MSEPIVFCKGGGCTAKLGPGVLERVLSRLPKGERDPRLLVGFDSCDDGAVYQVSEELAVVQTLDFFPPMVDDPYLFGQIAAANALSDIYAMGGEVKTALNIVCFPEQMDLNVLGRILQGGSEKVLEAGGVLAGGHSIADDSVKYGLSVMGFVHPGRILTNVGAQVGDRLILTKPLGVGLVCTAARVGLASQTALDEAIASMTTLNRSAAQVLQQFEVHACTDVTGFGLLGHLHEMLGGVCSATLEAQRIPHIANALDYADDCLYTAAGQRNRNHVGAGVRFVNQRFAMEELLFDPQTSGGLLAALPASQVSAAVEQLRQQGLNAAAIGTITPRREMEITVR
jgi:selenide,water dikinase